MTGLRTIDQRYYASTYGRFNTADPYQASGGPSSPASWNRYSYTRGDPVNRRDPSGLRDCLDCIGDDDGGGGDWGGDDPLGGDYWSGYYGCGGSDPSLSSTRVCFQGGPGTGQLPGGGGGGSVGGTGSRSGAPTPPICNSKILQPTITSVFAQMGKDLGINPTFFMAVALQESGWNLSHVYGTNAQSNGQPLNNLFGLTQAGGDNLSFPNVMASATYWEMDWGPYLTNKPTTIQQFVTDLIGTPGHMYNTSPTWPISIEGGTFPGGPPRKKSSTIGTYQSILNALKKCNISF
jgi:RHS repeat-associated protein